MPCLILLDGHYRVIDAERADHLPTGLERALREHLESSQDAHFVWQSSAVVRASRFNGRRGVRCIVVTIEPIRTRAPIDEAAQRFFLSRRETEVLECILRGCSGVDIAARLHISKSTVGEYFKHLAAKIGAHNRAELVARVFDWRAD